MQVRRRAASEAALSSSLNATIFGFMSGARFLSIQLLHSFLLFQYLIIGTFPPENSRICVHFFFFFHCGS
jgi:hypothetical protein